MSLPLAPNPTLPPVHPAANLSEWYVCQSAGGMPTPPSTEHSPVGMGVHGMGMGMGMGALSHHHHFHPAAAAVPTLHHAVAQY